MGGASGIVSVQVGGASGIVSVQMGGASGIVSVQVGGASGIVSVCGGMMCQNASLYWTENYHNTEHCTIPQ